MEPRTLVRIPEWKQTSQGGLAKADRPGPPLRLGPICVWYPKSYKDYRYDLDAIMAIDEDQEFMYHKRLHRV